MDYDYDYDFEDEMSDYEYQEYLELSKEFDDESSIFQDKLDMYRREI